jgi:hypothetical protein
MSAEEVNRKLRFYITDPVMVYEVWFDQYGREDPIAERRDQLTATFSSMLNQLQMMISEGDTAATGPKASDSSNWACGRAGKAFEIGGRSEAFSTRTPLARAVE